jgi:hypothetical protein
LASGPPAHHGGHRSFFWFLVFGRPGPP